MVRRLNALLEEARQLCNASAPDVQALGRLLSHVPAAHDPDERLAGIGVLWSYTRQALDPDVFAQAHRWAWCRLLLPHALWSHALWWSPDAPATSRHLSNLMDVDLRGADLAWAELHGIRLDRADLRGADLRGANLQAASLCGADLTRARLQGAPLPQSALALLPQGSSAEDRDDEVSYSLQGTSLSMAMGDDVELDMDDALELEGSELSQTNLLGADLSRARLGYADLRGANLQEADLRGADLVGADLRGADLSGADLSGATLESATLLGANFFWAQLTEANLRLAHIEGANLEGADLRRADLRGVKLSWNNLRGANLRGARWSLTDAELREAIALRLGGQPPSSAADPLPGCTWDRETRWPNPLVEE